MTTNLAKFGRKEHLEAANILTALAKNGWPDYFDLVGVKLCVDLDYGDVYLTNDGEQLAALTDEGKLERYYFSPTGKHKGFFEDLVAVYKEMEDIEDIDLVKEIAEVLNRSEDIPDSI